MRELIVLILLAAASVGCLYMLVAASIVLGFARKPSPGRGPWPALTILKPLHGDEAGLFDNLASLCRQDYPGPVQLVCGVTDPDDPAIATVARLRTSYPDRSIELVAEAPRTASNPKVANLLNMSPRIAHDVVVISDSDIRVGPDYLMEVVGALQRQQGGAVTCPYYGIANAGQWSELSRLGIDSHFLPGVMLAARFKLARPCMGSTIALGRASLTAIGGFQAADILADDHAIGEALARVGQPVTLLSHAVGHVCNETSFAQLWHHELRWAQTIRVIDRLGYCGWSVGHAFPLALIALVLGGGVIALCASLVALVCRGLLLAVTARRYALPAHSYWLIPARDLLSFAVYVAGLFARNVSWQEQRYRLMPEGTLRRSSLP